MRKSFVKSYSTPFVMPSEKVFNQKREYIATESIDFEGRPIQSSVIKVDSPADRYKGFKASDFALENQLAVGVVLNPVKCSLATSFEEDAQIK